MKQSIAILVSCLLAFNSNAQINLIGKVIDAETTEGIPGARIYVPDLGYGAKTTVDGSFVLTNLPERILLVQISAPAFGTITVEVDFSTTTEKNFILKRSHIELDEILISNPASRLQSENIIGIHVVKIKKIRNSGAMNLADGLATLKGVDVISTGMGIGKPVIRGLQGNRIVTYADGVRIENQQWGGDHGIGIGDLGIGGVEIIKGPASLLYGADAMGGVLYFVPESYAESNSVQAYAETMFNSGTLGSMNEYGAKLNQRVKLNLSGSYNTFTNYLLPSSKYVRGTAFDEGNFKGSLGYNTSNWATNIRYSYLQNNFGITEDSLSDTLIDRRINNPFQRIENHRFSAENIFFFKNSKVRFTFGYSKNIRHEYDSVETVSNDPLLDMTLETATYDLKWYKPLKNKKGRFISGIQGMYQSNKNRGSELLIPNANKIDAGLLIIYKHSFSENFTMQFGKRLDFRAISAAEVIDTALNYSSSFLDELYGGMTVSGGIIYSRKASKIRFNLATAYRAPNTSELTSFGVHHGSLRFEIGSTDLRKEQNLQLDLEYERNGEHLKFAINPFFNTVKDYIYLDPDTTYVNGFRVYEYKQDDVFLFGGEAGFHLHPHGLHWLHLESNYSYVQAKYYKGGHPPLTPQPKLSSTVRIEFDTYGDFKFENVYVNHVYKFEQIQTATGESASPAYHIINAGLRMMFSTEKVNFSVNAGIRNLLNTSYIDHLSRFKDFGIPAIGRNFFFSLRIDLYGTLIKKYTPPTKTRQDKIKEKIEKSEEKSDEPQDKKEKIEKRKKEK
ncbi:TonB-dependent receptor [Crocinitomix catalasitica]|nr:TonB-dependent receptor [Crocinitomix catalasitica]